MTPTPYACSAFYKRDRFNDWVVSPSPWHDGWKIELWNQWPKGWRWRK